jgi:PAS domain S-box-containing protein
MALRLPIRAQLLLLGLAVGLPAISLFTWHAFEKVDGARQEAYAQVRVLAGGVALQLDAFLADQEAMLGRVAARPLVKALDPKRCDPALLEFAALHPEFMSMGLRDTAGRLVCTSNANPIRIERPGQEQWFEDGLRTPGLSAGDAVAHPLGRWISVLTYPVRRDDGRLAGLVGLPVDLLKLQGRLFRDTPKEASVLVVDRSRRVLMRSTSPEAWIGKPLPAEFSAATLAPPGGVVSAKGLEANPRLWAVATVSRSGWQVMAGLPENEVLAPYRAERDGLLGLGAAMLAAVLALAWWAGTVIARPVVALGRTAARVAAGESGARAPLAGPAELEEVARQFNRMLDVRAELDEERAALVGHFGQLAQRAREIILLADPEDRIVEANEAAAVAFGWSAAELRGMPLKELQPEDARSDFRQRWEESARPEGVLFETRCRRRDGRIFPVEVSASAIEIEGRAWRQGFLRDISARRAAQDELRRLTVAYATLSETNQSIVRAADEDTLLRRVCQVAVDFGGYLGAWIGLVDARSGELRPLASHGPIGDYVKRLRLSTDPARPEGQGPAALAMRAGLPRYSDDFLCDPATVPWQEMARELGIRAHAVLPLRRGGEVTGVLALCAAAPGAFDAQTRSLLEEMATDVSFALDNFDRKAALAEWTDRYEATVRASGQILLDRDLVTGGMKIAGDVRRILGYGEDELAGGLARWAAIILPGDQARFAREMERVVREGQPFHLQYRILRRDETTLVVQDDGYFVRDGEGRAVRMIGFVADITERKLAEDRIRSQLEELRRWHSAMLGREVRVLQLKREVNEALAEAGKPARYASPQGERAEGIHA